MFTVDYVKENYYVHKINDEGLIVASLLVRPSEGIDEDYLIKQANAPTSEIHRELSALERGKEID